MFVLVSTDLGTLGSCLPWPYLMSRGMYPAGGSCMATEPPARVHLFSQEAQISAELAKQAGTNLPDDVLSINVDRYYDPASLVREPTWSAVVDDVERRIAWAGQFAEACKKLEERPDGMLAHLPPQSSPVLRSLAEKYAHDAADDDDDDDAAAGPGRAHPERDRVEVLTLARRVGELVAVVGRRSRDVKELEARVAANAKRAAEDREAVGKLDRRVGELAEIVDRRARVVEELEARVGLLIRRAAEDRKAGEKLMRDLTDAAWKLGRNAENRSE